MSLTHVEYEDTSAIHFLSILSSFSLTQHITFPTHNLNHTLDLVITHSDSTLSPVITPHPLSPSDHFPIHIKLNISLLPPPPPTLVTFRSFSSLDVNAFMSDLSSSRLITHTPNSLGSLLISYDLTLTTLLNKHAPLKTKLFSHGSNHHSNRWFTPALRAFRSLRRHAENTFRRTHSPADLSTLSKLTNRYHKLIASTKKLYYSNIINSCSDCPRRLWSTVNSLLHRTNSHPLPNSSSFSSLANSFASFFSDKIEKLRLAFSSNPSSPSDPHSPGPSSTPPAFTSFRLATDSEIQKLILDSPNKQSQLDPLPTWLLKQCLPILLPVITKIVNLSLSTGSFPSSFKHSLVTPLLKKPSLDKDNLNNYRPISNLSFLSKLTERVVKSRLMEHLSANNLLNPFQSAYTKHHSTETVLLSLFDSLANAIGSKMISCLCLLDLSAAFDTIDHSILIHRLSTWFGLDGTVLSWFSS